MTTVPMGSREMGRHLTPVPLRRLLRVHLDIWRAQRGVVVGTILALVVGLASTVFGVVMLTGTVTAGSLGRQFVASTEVYTLVWLAIGAVAAAAPFRSRWAAMVLVVAPRRLRWLVACFGSVLVWALGTTAVFGLLAWAAATSALALDDRSIAPGMGVPTHFWQVAVGVAVNVTVGFLLGAAARGAMVALILGYVVAPATPLLAVRSVDLGRWLDLGAATEMLAGAKPAGPPLITAVCVWVVVPALVAVWRLRRSPVP